MLLEINRPTPEEYLGYYKHYVDLAVEKAHSHYFQEQVNMIEHLLSRVNKEQEDFAYESGKWTIRQLLRHIIDTERIFLFRAVAVSRGEQQDLPGFEQDDYVQNGPEIEANLSDLLKEFRAARSSTEWFYKNLSDRDWKRSGTANGASVSSRALAYLIIGHAEHHYNILRDRYCPHL